MTAGVTHSINASKREHKKDINRNRLGVDYLYDNVDIFTTYSLALFEELCIDMPKQTITPVELK